MQISIGSDHAGYRLKSAIAQHLKAQGHEILDQGTHGEAAVDYPDFAQAVAHDVACGNTPLGILVCSSGIGISIAANKMPGIRAALCMNEDMAEFSRRHNNANIICLGQKYIPEEIAQKLVDIFLRTDFEGGRHQLRVKKIEPGTSKTSGAYTLCQ
ncbi:MAG: ribose 5-phosphate isomerase B [Puniceicoccales bacterium]|jgi:ribose 5-phosphate isomerase B|nr:ribose 5-phosphate isomerase B [Puniceicoccales bacterium]